MNLYKSILFQFNLIQFNTILYLKQILSIQYDILKRDPYKLGTITFMKNKNFIFLQLKESS